IRHVQFIRLRGHERRAALPALGRVARAKSSNSPTPNRLRKNVDIGDGSLERARIGKPQPFKTPTPTVFSAGPQALGRLRAGSKAADRSVRDTLSISPPVLARNFRTPPVLPLVMRPWYPGIVLLLLCHCR